MLSANAVNSYKFQNLTLCMFMWFCSLKSKERWAPVLISYWGRGSHTWGENKRGTGGIHLIATVLWLHPLLVPCIAI